MSTVGTVYEALNTAIGKRVAMKFMSSQNASATARELRSLQSIQRLSHPYLLRMRQVWSLPGQIIISMDLAEASLLDLFLLYNDEFGKPIDTTPFMGEADDPIVVFNLADQVRETIQETLHALLERRPDPFG